MPLFLRRYGTLIGFVAVIGFFWLRLPETFLTSRNLLNITQQMSMLAVVSATMTVVMAMGDFDLSVGSIASLAGVVAALAFVAGGSSWTAVPASLAVGLAAGLLNGFLVAYVGILPFIATLGALTIFSGLAFWLSGGKTIFGSAIPASFGGFARGGLPFGLFEITIPNLTLVALCVLLAIWIFLEQTVYGRRLYAIGGNAEAARLAGVRIRPLRLAAFGVSGLGAASAGLMLASRVASANPTQGYWMPARRHCSGLSRDDYERRRPAARRLHAIGRPDLGILGNGLTQMNVDSYVREMITGSIIIIAVAAGSLGRASEG